MPSVSSRKLCNAQQVLKMWSAISIECVRVPVLSMRQRCFKMPNVHSTSLRMLLSYSENLISFLEVDILNGQINMDHFKHPLSQSNHTPLCLTSIIDPSFSLSNK